MRNPDELIVLAEKLHKPMERYLKWKQITERYERGKHTKFAQCFDFEMRELTIKERELAAYANQEYKNYLEEWDSAEKEKIKAQVEYENLKMSFEALQSALSFDREAMKRNI